MGGGDRVAVTGWLRTHVRGDAAVRPPKWRPRARAAPVTPTAHSLAM
ncbi:MULTISPECIES: hypothetical protein [unclassified Streptomyces]